MYDVKVGCLTISIHSCLFGSASTPRPPPALKLWCLCSHIQILTQAYGLWEEHGMKSLPRYNTHMPMWFWGEPLRGQRDEWQPQFLSHANMHSKACALNSGIFKILCQKHKAKKGMDIHSTDVNNRHSGYVLCSNLSGSSVQSNSTNNSSDTL